MARISKNTNLSGAVANLVFVQNGKEQYVRSKPGKVKQSAQTKAAASVFGWASTRDKIYRKVLVEKSAIVTDNRYAARHRARMTKTLIKATLDQSSTADLSFQNPEALLGFDFNSNLPWEKSTQFYPEFSHDEARKVQCKIPSLQWGKQIKPPKKITKAQLIFEAFTINPNTENIAITNLATLTVEISATQNQEAITWDFPFPTNSEWVVVIGILSFDLSQSNLSSTERSSATYLWAKNTSEIE